MAAGATWTDGSTRPQAMSHGLAGLGAHEEVRTGPGCASPASLLSISPAGCVDLALGPRAKCGFPRSLAFSPHCLTPSVPQGSAAPRRALPYPLILRHSWDTL